MACSRGLELDKGKVKEVSAPARSFDVAEKSFLGGVCSLQPVKLKSELERPVKKRRKEQHFDMDATSLLVLASINVTPKNWPTAQGHRLSLRQIAHGWWPARGR